jgi:hypothetical protein
LKSSGALDKSLGAAAFARRVFLPRLGPLGTPERPFFFAADFFFRRSRVDFHTPDFASRERHCYRSRLSAIEFIYQQRGKRLAVELAQGGGVLTRRTTAAYFGERRAAAKQFQKFLESSMDEKIDATDCTAAAPLVPPRAWACSRSRCCSEQ